MSETREYDGPNWRDNPDEYKPPVRRSGNFLASRGYENPEIAAVKFVLADDILHAVADARQPALPDTHPDAGQGQAAGLPITND